MKTRLPSLRRNLLRFPLFYFLFAFLFLLQAAAVAQPTQENFDSGTKSSYAAAPVALSSGTWILDDALLGNSEQDRKTGAQALRLQQLGKLTMDFALLRGAGTLTVQHAIFGKDASSSWELWAQAGDCSCNKWTKIGATVSTTSHSLQTAAFTLNLPGSVRLEIRKTSGGKARLNLDELVITQYDGSLPPPPLAVDNDHLALGNPSGATADPSQANNYLMRKPQYALSYSRDRGTPNWVSWHLDGSDRGSADRQDDFRADPSLPAGWYQVNETSYRDSGFDRGHNCPSADRTSSTENNSATFLMTNMIPQAPQNNQGPWANLENYARTLLPAYEIYLIMGSYGSGGTGANGGITHTLDNGRVTVPSRIWKVLVILPVGDNDESRINASTRIIAVDTPNSNAINPDWASYRTSIDAIEAASGLDLLSNLPQEVQAQVEAGVDRGPSL
ncbi:MAG: DNA/RNA non-specific endonuclease [Adhaeribacter sp.]